MENSLVIPQKLNHRIAIQPCNSTSKYIPKEMENRDSNRDIYVNVHSSAIRNNKNVETPG